MARIVNAEYVCLAVPSIELDTSLIHTDYLPRERIVRCRDCAYFFEGDCMLLHFDMPDMDGGFCAWGEPRDGGSE